MRGRRSSCWVVAMHRCNRHGSASDDSGSCGNNSLGHIRTRGRFSVFKMVMTRTKILLAVFGCFSCLTWVACPSEAPISLRVLYVGHRTPEFEPCLKAHFVKVESTPLESFQPRSAKDFDVVLLDWPQSLINRQQRVDTSPLGKREEWAMPTVLLGSAGLNLAVAWKIKGGFG